MCGEGGLINLQPPASPFPEPPGRLTHAGQPIWLEAKLDLKVEAQRNRRANSKAPPYLEPTVIPLGISTCLIQ